MLTIFIVDDDKLHHFGMKRMLHHLKVDTEIVEFYNGQQAFDFLQQHQHSTGLLPDVIFLDINMPVMNGWQFLELFETLQCTASKRIIIYVVTSSADISEVAKAASYKQVSNYILKPVTIQWLQNVLQGFPNA